MGKTKIEMYQLKGGKTNVTLNYPELRETVLMLRAINHDLRKAIIYLLSQNEKMNVTSIYLKLRLEQSVASQHLAILRKAGIVNTERNGKYIYYTLNKERIDEIAILSNKLSII